MSLPLHCSTWQQVRSGRRVGCLAGSEGLNGSPGACGRLASDHRVPSRLRRRGCRLQSVGGMERAEVQCQPGPVSPQGRQSTWRKAFSSYHACDLPAHTYPPPLASGRHPPAWRLTRAAGGSQQRHGTCRRLCGTHAGSGTPPMMTDRLRRSDRTAAGQARDGFKLFAWLFIAMVSMLPHATTWHRLAAGFEGQNNAKFTVAISVLQANNCPCV